MQWLTATNQFFDQLASDTTKKGYRQNLMQFEKYLVQTGIDLPIQVESVTKEHIEQYLTHLEIDRQCEPSTCQRHYYGLSSFFTYALNEKYITIRPTVGIQLKSIDKKKPVFITRSECEELLQLIKKPVIAIAIRCQFETGLRAAECLALQIEAVNFDECTLFVKKGKGGKSRTVPITTDFAKKLADYLKHDRPVVEGSYVFATKRSGRISPTYLNREIKKAVTALGWRQHITCHTLRHSFASNQMNSGVPIVQIQQWLGHESLASTGTYAHLEMDRARNDHVVGL